MHSLVRNRLLSVTLSRGERSCESDGRHSRSPIGHRAGASDPTLRSALEHGPADVVPQPLVIKDEIADRRRELVALPLAFQSRGSPGLPFRHGSTCGSDRVGGGTKLVRGDVRDGPGLASRVRGMPCWPTQISGRTHRMATKRASLHHLDLATHPCASRLDSLTRPCVFRLSRFEEVEDVLGARCRPKSEEMVIGIGKTPASPEGDEARVSNLREDHGLQAGPLLHRDDRCPRRIGVWARSNRADGSRRAKDVVAVISPRVSVRAGCRRDRSGAPVRAEPASTPSAMCGARRDGPSRRRPAGGRPRPPGPSRRPAGGPP